MNSRGRIRVCNKEDRKGSLNANQVLRRLSVLCEGRQFVEAAHLVNRLGPTSLQWIVAEMPLDLLAEALPHSAPLLENLFSRLCTVAAPSTSSSLSSSPPSENVGVDRIIWHLVKLFGNPFDYNLVQRCDKLVKFIGIYQPDLKSQLSTKSSSLESAIQGLGIHGLTHINDGSNGGFQSLYSSLRKELQSHVEAYKNAINVIDETELATSHCDPAQASHQRLLAYTYDDVQHRLIQNKTLLTKLEQPGPKQLEALVGHLRQRIEKDKEVLVSVNEIKKLDRDVDLKEWPAAKIIMDFTKGCKTVVSLMERREPKVADDSGSASEGYHSEPEADEKKLLAEQYYDLYKSSRVETLKALNENHQFEIAESVKLKILFSVVVLAFRSCHNLRERKLLEVRRTLNAIDASSVASDAINQLESAVKHYLTTNCDNFPLDDVEKTVVSQIYSTLHDYACIRQLLEVLMAYIKKCVRLAWKLCNQPKSCHLDNDFTLSKINPKKHTRASMSSCQKSSIIQYFLWPALFQGGECVSKAIVVT